MVGNLKVKDKKINGSNNRMDNSEFYTRRNINQKKK